MSEQITLVKGYFRPAEAADVLISLINDKIKFHTVQSLNLGDEKSLASVASETRIAELKAAKQLVQNLVIKAHAEGYELEINSTIDIHFQRRNPSKNQSQT